MVALNVSSTEKLKLLAGKWREHKQDDAPTQ